MASDVDICNQGLIAVGADPSSRSPGRAPSTWIGPVSGWTTLLSMAATVSIVAAGPI